MSILRSCLRKVSLYMYLLYSCNEIHLIQPFFQLVNKKYCITLLMSYFSLSPSYMFYPHHKHKIQHLMANSEWEIAILVTQITTHPYLMFWRFTVIIISFRIKEKEINMINVFSSAVTCLHNVMSSKIWRDVICYGVAT